MMLEHDEGWLDSQEAFRKFRDLSDKLAKEKGRYRYCPNCGKVVGDSPVHLHLLYDMTANKFVSPTPYETKLAIGFQP